MRFSGPKDAIENQALDVVKGILEGVDHITDTVFGFTEGPGGDWGKTFVKGLEHIWDGILDGRCLLVDMLGKKLLIHGLEKLFLKCIEYINVLTVFTNGFLVIMLQDCTVITEVPAGILSGPGWTGRMKGMVPLILA